MKISTYQGLKKENRTTYLKEKNSIHGRKISLPFKCLFSLSFKILDGKIIKKIILALPFK